MAEADGDLLGAAVFSETGRSEGSLNQGAEIEVVECPVKGRINRAEVGGPLRVQ